jgi:hypothetical protein
VADAETFQQDLVALGFRPVQNRMGEIQFALQATPYLTYSVHWRPQDESVLFTWEHALAELMDAMGLQLGANEELNQFLFPKHDAKGGQDVAFVVQEMDRVEQILRGISLLEGG